MLKSLQVCGTSGSGKTTLVRQLLEEMELLDIRNNAKGTKPLVYHGMWDKLPVYILGSYEGVTGGCDNIRSVSEVAGLLEEYREHDGVMVFEGLMISHMIGTVGTMQKGLGVDKHWRAFLDTELQQCLDNVLARRKARGMTKPFNPTNTQKDWPRVKQCRFNWENQGGEARTIRYDHAWYDFCQIMEELYNG